MAGWSLGGLATLGATMGMDNIRGNPVYLPKYKRVKAVVVEDASTWNLYFDQMDSLAIPGMFLDSAEYGGLCNVRAFAANQAEEYRVKIINTVHDSFAIATN